MSEAAVAPSKVSGHTILAFDFGSRWIGVAVGDTETRIANPLGMFEAESRGRRMAQVAALVSEWRPQRLLVGLPLALDGGEHDMTRRARRFARQLEARFHLPVELSDERLSSAAAEATLRETGRDAREHKHAVHALAAKIILQSYLDESPRR
ncbi:MAG: Holliday junction resolvase RuvX [Betaproteobacteria bacterium]|nr:MAG: Holliday junction resolvase RuvX [Betaproteobacteria bacterium]